MEIFRKEMKLLGYSITSLGKEMGKGASNIHGWINGDFVPNAESIKKLKQIGFSDTAVLNPSKEVEV